MKLLHLFLGLSASFTWILLEFTTSTLAQTRIRADDSLGNEQSSVRSTNTDANGRSTDLVIEGGARRESNLFHSFSDFNVEEQQRVYFDNPSGIARILARVTGNNGSEILGTLGVNGNADLFLINPNGILFGQNATLDVRGSFIASTAESVFFDNYSFSAANPQSPPLLTVSVPTGLQFGNNPGSIINQSTTQLPKGMFGPPSSSNDPFVGLRVLPGRTLALIGGNITLPGGEVTAPGGRIELGSIASSGQIDLIQTNDGWALEYNGVQDFGTIRLFNIADVDASGEGGGEIQVRGDRIVIRNGSNVRANTLGERDGGGISLTASDFILIRDPNGLDPEEDPISGIFARVLRNEDADEETRGEGGDISVVTSRLNLFGGAQISTSTDSIGDAGTITVNALEIELVGVALDANGKPLTDIDNGVPFTSPTTLSTVTRSQGRAGNISIQTQQLILRDGATLQTSTESSGDAGNLQITATDSVEVVGTAEGLSVPTAIAALSGGVPGTDLIFKPKATGEGGDLQLTTGELIVRDESILATGSANSTQPVAAGNLVIRAQTVELDQQARLLANTNSGQGGNINLQIGNLLVLRHGSEISTTAGIAGTPGNGGDITISADFVLAAPSENSDISANAFTGRGGNIQINANVLGIAEQAHLTPQSDITATSARGVSGEIIINSPDVDPSQGLTELPSTPIQTELAQGCQVEGGVASAEFFNTGRGGVPSTPYEPLSNDDVLDDVRLPIQQNLPLEDTDSSSAPIPADRIVEAQGWTVNNKGQVVLMAEIPGSPSTECSLH